MVDVVVVGAGVVGASVAYHLARAGAGVVLVDRSLPAVRVRWHGSLSWGEEEPPPSTAGPGERLLPAAQVARLEPHLRRPPPRAVHTPGDGAVDPVALTEALVRGAREHGAEVMTGVAVTALRVREGRVLGVQTSSGPVGSGTVVLAAGADAPGLCAPLGVDLPVAPSPALLMRFTAPPGLVRTLVATHEVEVREAADGHLLVPGDYDGETTQDQLHRAGQRMLAELAATFTGAEDVRLVSVRVGRRPMPADGSPVIGPLPGTVGGYLAVMHSGVTLAPSVGRLVAAEVTRGVEAEELRDLRPSRFVEDAA